ncbi:MAG TPA: helix-turn-helix transcriptional regulator [Solirubrobacterales bacterium]|nr:helix-turn-helix transcriptional regulator [Solirubrobacterales bacterium]
MPQPSLAQIGAAIRSLRKKRKLSIEALAAEADMHPYSVSRIERGEQNPSWITLVSLADALGTNMVDLVRLASEQPRT